MRLIYAYLRIVLFLGFKSHVYNLSSRWGSLAFGMPRRYNAAWEIQKDLLKRGYFKCPSCEWATELEHEHFLHGRTFCSEYHESHSSVVPWDEDGGLKIPIPTTQDLYDGGILE
jgi:hypothetical protein